MNDNTTLVSSLFYSLAFLTLILLQPSSSLPLVAQVTKDPSTLHYTATIHLHSPPLPASLLLHLGASSSWLDCTTNHSLSTHAQLPCNSSLCFSCPNHTCSLLAENPVSHRSAIFPALLDLLALPSTNGHNPGPLTALPSHLLSCSQTSSLRKGLPKPSSGLLALGRSNCSFQSQVSYSLSLPNTFSLCLSGSPSAPGVAFFGTSGPLYFLPPPGVDVSQTLIFTPLVPSPSTEYYINLTAMEVNGKRIPIDSSLLVLNEKGRGGTKLSTAMPYTTMHTSIYRALKVAFVDEATRMNLTVVGSVKRFEVCFDAGEVESGRTGPVVPTIDLVLDREDVVWRMYGANSMAWAEKGKELCLAIVDGGKKGGAAVVVGGYQMEDRLVQLDLEGMRVGFSSSLLEMGTSCANFNFTAVAL